MKVCSFCLAPVALFAAVVYSQSGRDARDGGRPGSPPRHPVFQLFDADDDGEISAAEMEKATAVQKSFDKNADGVLTPEELPRPPRPGDRGPGGREGAGPPGGGREGGPPPRDGGGRKREEAPPREQGPPGTVNFSGGYETEGQDRGRPVALIAAALGVKPEVFRQAFSNINPARGGGPTAEQARANKKVLMDALGKYGITNERLDEVSNYYRYNAEAGEVWKRTPAVAKAILKDGRVTAFTITQAGAGYTNPPTVTVTGHPDVKVQATLEFTQDFKTNGRVKSLTVVENETP